MDGQRLRVNMFTLKNDFKEITLLITFGSELWELLRKNILFIDYNIS